MKHRRLAPLGQQGLLLGALLPFLLQLVGQQVQEARQLGVVPDPEGLLSLLLPLLPLLLLLAVVLVALVALSLHKVSLPAAAAAVFGACHPEPCLA